MLSNMSQDIDNVLDHIISFILSTMACTAMPAFSLINTSHVSSQGVSERLMIARNAPCRFAMSGNPAAGWTRRVKIIDSLWTGGYGIAKIGLWALLLLSNFFMVLLL